MDASSPTRLRAYQRLVERARADEQFVGGALAEFQESRDLGLEELGRWLGCPDARALDRVALCRLPDDGEETFSRQVRQVAEFAPCSADHLVQLLREVLALRSMRRGAQKSQTSLLAARDRQPEAPKEGDG